MIGIDKIFDDNGYLDSNSDNFSPFKIINGGNITMNGVSQELFAIPFSGGKPQGTYLMKPNENYNFNSDFVLEIPKEKMKDNLPKFQFGTLFNPLLYLDPTSTQTTSLFGQRRLNDINNVGQNEIDIFGLNNLKNITGTSDDFHTGDPRVDYRTSVDITDDNLPVETPPPTIDPNKQEIEFQNTKFSDFLQDPAALADIDLNSALFTAGQSFGFDSDIIQNPEARRQARSGNLLRGIGSVGKSVLNIGRLVGAGLGYQNRLNNFYENLGEKKRRALVGTYQFEDGGLLQFLRNGGTVDELSPEKALTGEYITGLPEHAEDKANAEIEVDEYVKHPNGDVQKVIGKTHEQGGEKVNLQAGTIVISDNLKIGGDNAKECRKEYDLDVKASHTFADVVDKYTTKIGLKKLNEEQEKLFIKLKKEEDTEDEATSNLNRQFLSERINDIEEQKKELEQQRSSFVDFIFEKQEKSKPKEKQEELEIFAQGGMVKDKRFKELCKKYNLNEDQAIALYDQFKNGGKKKWMPKYQDGTRTNQFLSPDDINYNFSYLNPNAVLEYQLQHQNQDNPLIFDNFDLNSRLGNYQKIIPDLFGQFFNQNEEGVFTPKEGDRTVEQFQRAYNEYVGETANYLKELGVDETALNSYVDQIKFLDQESGTARGFDNKLGQFTSTRSGFRRDVVTPEQLKQLNEKGIYTGRQALGNVDEAKQILGDETYAEVVKNLDKFKKADYTIGVVQPSTSVTTTTTPVTTPTTPEKKEEVNNPNPNDNIDDLDISQIRKRLRLPYLPDQSTTPPNALIPHVKIERQYERLDPFEITNEENLKEIFRSQDFANEQLSQLPDSQRRAALANLIANSQENINKSVTQTEIANAQNFQQTEQFNIGQSNREEDTRAVDTLDFERRQLTALAKTQADLDNYFDFNRRIRLGNFNTVNRFNLLNDLYENYNVSPFGGVNFDASQLAQFYFKPSATEASTTTNVTNNK